MDSKKPYLAVVLIQTIYAGQFIVSKAAFNHGMNSFVFVFYRQAIATVVLLPFAILIERKRAPPLTLLTFFKIFMLSLFGITICLNVYNVALIYTSATLAAACTNTLPVITFFLALCLRMETASLKKSSGRAKIMGVALCMAGALTLAFFKGPHMKPLIDHPLIRHGSEENSSNKSWVKGVFIMLTSNTLWGSWLVFQVKVLKVYPSKLMLTALQSLLSTIQSFVAGMIFVRDLDKWKPHFDIGLLAVVYCGIMVTGVSFYLQTYCVEKRGPVFVAMSTPLALIITIFSSALFLGEQITLGRVLGGVILVAGLYSVLWGKSKERKDAALAMEEDGKGKEQTALEGGKLKEQRAVEEDEKTKEQRDTSVLDHEPKKSVEMV